MPHFIVEHSANVDADMMECAALIRDVAADTGLFPLAGIRVRTIPCETVMIADGHGDNAFVAVTARIGAGRSDKDKRAAAVRIFQALRTYFEDQPEGHFMLSFDMVENDPNVSFKWNTVHDRLKTQ